jgi:hypothetical protein
LSFENLYRPFLRKLNCARRERSLIKNVEEWCGNRLDDALHERTVANATSNITNATEDSGELFRVRSQVPEIVVVSGSCLGRSSGIKKVDSLPHFANG